MPRSSTPNAFDSSLDRQAMSSLLAEVSNWGRWGDSDRLGTLNLIGSPQIARALSTVGDGNLVGLGKPVGPRSNSEYGSEFLHFMTSSGHEVTDEGMGALSDWIAMGLHGRVNTHLDAHAHIFWDGKTYNGLPANDSTASRGTAKGGIEPWFQGVMARGILVDVPMLRQVTSMGAGDSVRAEELDQWMAQNGIVPAPGDAIVIRTGVDDWPRAATGTNGGSPGLDISCVRWLKEHDTAILMSDATHDVFPRQYEACAYPIHTACIVGMGMWLVDNVDARRLVTACVELDRYTFCTVMAPLLIKHATGSPVNPVAIL